MAIEKISGFFGGDHVIRTSASAVSSTLRMPSDNELLITAQQRLAARQAEANERFAAAGFVPCKATHPVEKAEHQLREVAEEAYLADALGTLTSRMMHSERYAGQRKFSDRQRDGVSNGDTVRTPLGVLSGKDALDWIDQAIGVVERAYAVNMAHHDEILAKYGWKKSTKPAPQDAARG